MPKSQDKNNHRAISDKYPSPSSPPNSGSVSPSTKSTAARARALSDLPTSSSPAASRISSASSFVDSTSSFLSAGDQHHRRQGQSVSPDISSPSQPAKEGSQDNPVPHNRGKEKEKVVVDESGEALGQVASIIERAHHGSFDKDSDWSWHKVRLSPQQFAKLYPILDSCDPQLGSWARDRLRLDYYAGQQTLVIRLMTTKIHETIIRWLDTRISKELDTIFESLHVQRKEKKTGPEADTEVQGLHTLRRGDIIPSGAGKITFQDGSTACPDGQFSFLGAHYPPFVYEVAYSQKAQDLARLASFYYDKSGDGGIQTVLTIHLGYHDKESRRQKARNRHQPQSQAEDKDIKKQDDSASLCLYRGPDRILHNAHFRTKDGSRMDGELKLLLSDFLPSEGHPKAPSPAVAAAARQQFFTIPFSYLYDILVDAERVQSFADQTPPPPSVSSRSRKRRWSASPSPSEQDSKDWHQVNQDAEEEEDGLIPRRVRSDRDRQPKRRKSRDATYTSRLPDSPSISSMTLRATRPRNPGC